MQKQITVAKIYERPKGMWGVCDTTDTWYNGWPKTKQGPLVAGMQVGATYTVDIEEETFNGKTKQVITNIAGTSSPPAGQGGSSPLSQPPAPSPSEKDVDIATQALFKTVAPGCIASDVGYEALEDQMTAVLRACRNAWLKSKGPAPAAPLEGNSPPPGWSP
jgi:hypothetical protein